MAGEGDVLLGEAQRRAGGDPDLLAHDVDVGDHLGHRMLDLQARVHLDEIELAVLEQELDGADAAVAELAAWRRPRPRRSCARWAALRAGRGGLLQHLLVAALQRAVALAQMHDIAVAVGQHLDLDMARMGEVFLDIDGVIAEMGLGLGAREAEGLRPSRSRLLATFMPLPPPPAAALISTG